MNEEKESEFEKLTFQDYLPSSTLVGVIFGLVTSVVGLFFIYQQINSEPSTSMLGMFMGSLSMLAVCLIAACAGLVAVWHFTKEVTSTLKLGQGAVIGFLTGAVIAVVSVLLSELWATFIDPEMMRNYADSMIANFEAMDMPQSTLDDIAESFEEGDSMFRQLFINIPLYGVLNLITALIGVKIFADKPEDTF
tara:strand:+ start:7894 stop:8472 length:579 start_codon:yes stop_codon:yes gene_type:complete